MKFDVGADHRQRRQPPTPSRRMRANGSGRRHHRHRGRMRTAPPTPSPTALEQRARAAASPSMRASRGHRDRGRTTFDLELRAPAPRPDDITVLHHQRRWLLPDSQSFTVQLIGRCRRSSMSATITVDSDAQPPTAVAENAASGTVVGITARRQPMPMRTNKHHQRTRSNGRRGRPFRHRQRLTGVDHRRQRIAAGPRSGQSRTTITVRGHVGSDGSSQPTQGLHGQRSIDVERVRRQDACFRQRCRIRHAVDENAANGTRRRHHRAAPADADAHDKHHHLFAGTDDARRSLHHRCHHGCRQRWRTALQLDRTNPPPSHSHHHQRDHVARRIDRQTTKHSRSRIGRCRRVRCHARSVRHVTRCPDTVSENAVNGTPRWHHRPVPTDADGTTNTVSYTLT